MSSANSVLFLAVLLSLSCLSAVLGQGSGDAEPGNEGPSCDFRCDSGGYLIECGTKKTDKTSCESDDCCWNPYVPPGSPKCFRRNGGFAFCDNFRDNRTSCSDKAISKEECDRRSCCYDDSQGAGHPTCFFHNTNYDPRCPYNERVQCGKRKIDRKGCLKKGCCWSPKLDCKMEPSCFFPISDTNDLKNELNSGDPPPTPSSITSSIVDVRSEVKDEL